MNPIKSFSELESHFALIASTRRVAVVCPSDDHTMEVVERCINNYKIQFITAADRYVVFLYGTCAVDPLYASGTDRMGESRAV